MSKITNKVSPEASARAVQTDLDYGAKHTFRWAVISSDAKYRFAPNR